MCFPKAHLTDLLSWVKKWVRRSDEGEGLHVFRVRAVSPCISPGILPHAHVSHTRFKWPQASDTRKATGHDTEEQTGCNSCSCHLALLFMGYIQAQGQFSLPVGHKKPEHRNPPLPTNGSGTSTKVCEDHLSQWMSLPLLSLGSHSVWTTTGVQQPPALMGWATPGYCTGLLQLPH